MGVFRPYFRPYSPLIIFAFLLVAGVISSISSAAFVDLHMSGLTCEKDGSLRFVIETASTSSTPSTNLSAITLSATHLKLNKTLVVTGDFSRDILTNSPKTKADFQSDTGMLNETGNYRVELTYAGCRYPPCVEEHVAYRCPGFVYDCGRAAEEFLITSCRAFPDKYLITFEGLNRGQHETRNPLQDVEIFFETNARRISGTPYIAGKQLKDTGHDTYLLQFPRPAHETPQSLALGIRGCPEEMIRECAFENAQEQETFFLPVNQSAVPAPLSNASFFNHSADAVSSTASSTSPAPESFHPLFVPLLVVFVVVLVALVILLGFLYLKTE